MLGMEQMLCSMLGMKPADMKALVEGFSKAASEGVETLKRIEANQLDLKARMEALENGGR
jgi:hypothetical protein